MTQRVTLMPYNQAVTLAECVINSVHAAGNLAEAALAGMREQISKTALGKVALQLVCERLEQFEPGFHEAPRTLSELGGLAQLYRERPDELSAVGAGIRMALGKGRLDLAEARIQRCRELAAELERPVPAYVERYQVQLDVALKTLTPENLSQLTGYSPRKISALAKEFLKWGDCVITDPRFSDMTSARALNDYRGAAVVAAYRASIMEAGADAFFGVQ